MGISYLSSINMNQNPIYGFVLESLTTAPSNPVNGQIYFDSVDKAPYYYNGDAQTWFCMNADDVQSVSERVQALENLLTGSDSDSADTTINRLSEVLSFLNGVSDDETLLSSFLPATKNTTGDYTISKGINFEGNTLTGYKSADNFDSSWSISNDGAATFSSLQILSGSIYYPVLTSENTSFKKTTTAGTEIGVLTINGTEHTLYAPVQTSSGEVDLSGYAQKHEGEITGDGSTKTFSFGFTVGGSAVVAVYDYDTEEQVMVGVQIVGDVVNITFSVAPESGKKYTVVCVG